MSLALLQKLRLLIPGILLVLLFILASSKSIDEMTIEFFKFQPDNWKYLILIIIFGALWYAFNIRKFLWKPFRMRIDNNIKDSLVKPFKQTLSNDDDTYKEVSLFPLKARLGCWTCTVIRKDKAIKNLIELGYKSLIPLYEFRNWLISIRDEPKRRYNKRRNGQLGLGPFTINTRREIFERLQNVQRKVEWQLISDQEIEYIKEQWILDSE